MKATVTFLLKEETMGPGDIDEEDHNFDDLEDEDDFGEDLYEDEDDFGEDLYEDETCGKRHAGQDS